MSARAQAWAWDQEARTPGEKLVLLALADYADSDGICPVATTRSDLVASICDDVPLKERMVRRHIARLIAAGLVESDDEGYFLPVGRGQP